MVELNRLFFALWPDDAVRARCSEAVRDLKVRLAVTARWVPAERYHMTLFFLGSTVRAGQEAAVRAAAAAVEAPPFTLALDHAGCFKRRHPPWWLGARVVPSGLTALASRLHAGLLAARVVPDRERFVPHLTIVREGPRALPETAIRPIEWPVEDFVLVRSRMDRDGGYEVVGRWPLAPRASAQKELWEN